MANHHHTPARGCCPEHAAFRRRAVAALNLAVADDPDGASAAVGELQAHHGSGAITAALLTWVDVLVTRTPGVDHASWANPETAAAAADPVISWAIQVITARLTRDRPAFEELRAAVHGPGAVEAHVMSLLTLIATHLRADETRSS
ncbi:hypothetical protein AB0K21_42340 [Streptosporangium sp. NPDC049248]|uniref:hypothetical protein n=1 Tax=Streptosporangium sp. NPDC049248 TaxID=3155651 RepID=UPI003440C876